MSNHCLSITEVIFQLGSFKKTSLKKPVKKSPVSKFFFSYPWSSWKWPSLFCSRLHSFFIIFPDSLEKSLSLLLWKQNMEAPSNTEYTAANCGCSCWTWQSEVQKAEKPAKAAKNSLCLKNEYTVFPQALALFQQHSLFQHYWLFIVRLHNRLTQLSLVCI